MRFRFSGEFYNVAEAIDAEARDLNSRWRILNFQKDCWLLQPFGIPRYSHVNAKFMKNSLFFQHTWKYSTFKKNFPLSTDHSGFLTVIIRYEF